LCWAARLPRPFSWPLLALLPLSSHCTPPPPLWTIAVGHGMVHGCRSRGGSSSFLTLLLILHSHPPFRALGNVLILHFPLPCCGNCTMGADHGVGARPSLRPEGAHEGCGHAASDGLHPATATDFKVRLPPPPPPPPSWPPGRGACGSPCPTRLQGPLPAAPGGRPALLRYISAGLVWASPLALLTFLPLSFPHSFLTPSLLPPPCPLLVPCPLFSLLQNYTSTAPGSAGFKIYDGSCNNEVNHAVVVVGYNTTNNVDYWIVKNTWHPGGWGHAGYMYIRMLDGSGKCGMMT